MNKQVLEIKKTGCLKNNNSDCLVLEKTCGTTQDPHCIGFITPDGKTLNTCRDDDNRLNSLYKKRNEMDLASHYSHEKMIYDLLLGEDDREKLKKLSKLGMDGKDMYRLFNDFLTKCRLIRTSKMPHFTMFDIPCPPTSKQIEKIISIADNTNEVMIATPHRERMIKREGPMYLSWIRREITDYSTREKRKKIMERT